MRVTNVMMSNRMLLNINKNMQQLDTLYTQIASGKKIQVPSDDPIVASRALKFRTNLAQTTQYQRNVSQAQSWMGVTDQSFTNLNDIMNTLYERLNEGATGTLDFTDKQKVGTEITNLVQQLGLEMNNTYAGRYVFSGNRTDQPATMTQATSDTYTIAQTFSKSDIENTKSYQKLASAPTDPPIVNDVSILKLAYKNIAADPSNPLNSTVTLNPPPASGSTVLNKSINDADAYVVADGDPPHYIQETGELVLSKQDAAAFANGTTISYTKTGIAQGELNPVVYFDCTNTTTTKTYTMDDQAMSYELSVNTLVQINSLAKNVFTDKMYADLNALVGFINNAQVSNEQDLTAKYSAQGLTGTDLSDAVSNQMTQEKNQLQAVMQDRINNMLKSVDGYQSTISKENTDLGSRMNRVDLIGNRLDQNEGTYTQLMSDNEDVDVTQAIMQRNVADAAYQASLKVGANIVQLSLANFIQ